MMPGMRPLTVAMSVLRSRVVVVRFCVMSRTLWSDCAKAGSAMSALTLVRMLSIFGSIFSMVGTRAATLPIIPLLMAPVSVSPGMTRSLGLLASSRFIFTLPMRSLMISADEPLGMRRLLFTLKRTTTPLLPS